MYQKVLNQMREKVRSLEYVMTIHADEEMDDDELSIFDVEQIILTGEIIERQRDVDTGEWKYLVRGQTVEELDAVVVCKLSITNKLVIITMYVE